MNTRILISMPLALIACLLLGAPVVTGAAPADGADRSTRGTLLCGGASLITEQGIAEKTSSWSFRNYNERGWIRIDRVRIYDRYGALIYPVGTDFEPVTIGPHGTVGFGSQQLLGDYTEPLPARPLQFILDWSSVSGRRLLTLDGYVIRRDFVTSEDSPFGVIPLGIFTFDCRTIHTRHDGDREDD